MEQPQETIDRLKLAEASYRLIKFTSMDVSLGDMRRLIAEIERLATENAALRAEIETTREANRVENERMFKALVDHDEAGDVHRGAIAGYREALTQIRRQAMSLLRATRKLNTPQLDEIVAMVDNALDTPAAQSEQATRRPMLGDTLARGIKAGDKVMIVAGMYSGVVGAVIATRQTHVTVLTDGGNQREFAVNEVELVTTEAPAVEPEPEPDYEAYRAVQEKAHWDALEAQEDENELQAYFEEHGVEPGGICPNCGRTDAGCTCDQYDGFDNPYTSRFQEHNPPSDW